jgi:hypothetical protein
MPMHGNGFSGGNEVLNRAGSNCMDPHLLSAEPQR